MKYSKVDFGPRAVGPYDVGSLYRSWSVGTPGWAQTVKVWVGEVEIARASWPGLDGPSCDGFNGVEGAQAALRAKTVEELETTLRPYALERARKYAAG